MGARTPAGTKGNSRLPRSLWLRRPAARVARDKKGEGRLACRREEWEKELDDTVRGDQALLEVLLAVCISGGFSLGA